MERSKFNVGDQYYICSLCGEWVPAQRHRCDKCLADMDVNARRYTFTEADKRRETPGEGAQGRPGLPKPEHARKANKVGVLSELPLSAVENTGVDPIFEYTVSIYEQGQAREISKRVPINRTQYVMGRTRFLSDPRLGINGVVQADLQTRYVRINRENAVFLQLGDRLYVQYRNDGTEKTPIRVDGERLENNTRVELGDGSVVRFGYLRELDGCFDMNIYKRQNTEAGVSSAKIEQMMERMDDMGHRLDNVVETVSDVTGKLQEYFKKINLEKRDDETQEAYHNRVLSSVPKLDKQFEEECIRQFCKIKTDKGVQDCYSNMEVLLQQELYFGEMYGAAILESMFVEHYKSHPVVKVKENFAQAAIPLGKIAETFVMTELQQLVRTYLWKEFKDYTYKNKLNGKHGQGHYLLFLGGAREDIDGASEAAVRKLFAELGCAKNDEEGDKRWKAWKGAINELFKLSQARNNATHGSNVVSRKEYLENKRNLLTAGAFKEIHQYYQCMEERK